MRRDNSDTRTLFVRSLFFVSAAVFFLGGATACGSRPDANAGQPRSAFAPATSTTSARALTTTVFFDDFESGTLGAAAGGRWALVDANSSTSIVASSFAKKRGEFGLDVTDDHATAAPAGDVAFVETPSLSLGGDVYIRYWVKIHDMGVETAGAGNALAHSRLMVDATGSLLDLFSDNSGAEWGDTNNLEVVGRDASGSTPSDGIVQGISPPPFAWYLVELAVTGIGTTTGTRRLWVDGQLRSTNPVPRDLRGLSATKLRLGIPYSYDQAVTARVFYDDIRIDGSPPASKFAIAPASSSVSVDTCMAVEIALKSAVRNDYAPAPFDIPSISLDAGGTGGSFHTDSGCTSAPVLATSLSASASKIDLFFKSASVGTRTLRAGEADPATATSEQGDFLKGLSTITVTPAPTKLAFASIARTFVAGACGGVNTIQVQLRDSSDNPVQAGPGGQAFTLMTSSTSIKWYSDVSCTAEVPGGQFVIPPGQHTVSVHVLETKAGALPVGVTNSSGLSNPDPQPHTVNPGSAVKLGFQVGPSNVAAGVPMSPSVQVSVLDDWDNIVTTASDNVTLALASNPGSSALSGTLTRSASGGLATFSDLELNRAGTGYALEATATGRTAATSAVFDVTPGSATKLAFEVQPTNTVAGANIAPAVRVRVLDENDNLVTDSEASIALSLAPNPSSGVLSGTTVVNAVAGVATFSSLSIGRAGSGYTLQATSPDLASAPSSAFDVSPAAASKLAFTVQPGTSSAGAAFAPAIQVTVQDPFGNTVPSATPTVTMAVGSNPGSGSLLGMASVTASSGVATFSNIAIDKAATGYTLVASAEGLTGATSLTFDVQPGAATRLAFQVQPSHTEAGSIISPSVQVVVQDDHSNTVTNSTAAISINLGDNAPDGTLGGANVHTASAGVATFSELSIERAGDGYTLVASASGLAPATSSAFNVTPGSPVRLAFEVQPSNAVAGANISPAVQVRIEDAWGNTVTNSSAPVSLALSMSDGTGSTTGPTAVNAVNGIATFASLAIEDAAAGYLLFASADGMTSATSDAFDVTPAAAHQLSFRTQPSTTQAGQSISPAVEVAIQDAYGNVDTTAVHTIHIALASNPGGGSLNGSVSAAAVNGIAVFSDLSLEQAASGYALVATSSSLLSATSASFTVVAGAPAQLAFLSEPANVEAGAAMPAVQVAVQDALGNTVAESGTAVTLSLGTNAGEGVLSGVSTVSTTNGIAEFGGLSLDKASTGYTLRASTSDLADVLSSSFDVHAAAAHRIVFTTPTRKFAAGVCGGEFSAVNAQLRDAFDNIATAGGGGLSVTFSSTSSAPQFFSDAGCASSLPGGMTSISAGASSVSVYYLDSIPGTVELGASSAGLDPAPAQSHEVVLLSFADDFEAGALEVPAGRWEHAWKPGSSLITAGLAAAAAHRGDAGYRVVDAEDITGNGAEAMLNRSAPWGESVYQRYWFRLSGSNHKSGMAVSQILTAESRSILDVAAFVDTDVFKNSGHSYVDGDSTLDHTDNPETPALEEGVWYLVEAELTGIGTSNGRRRLWLNGVLEATSSPLDLTGISGVSEMLGLPYAASRTFTGTLDFDDYRSAAAPHASSFRVSLPSTVSAGDCTAVAVTLTDSVSNAPAASPYDFSASVSLAGVAGSVYSDGSCTSSTSTVPFEAGAVTETVYLKAESVGTVSLAVSFPDFLDGGSAATVGPGAPAALVFATGPMHTFTAGECAGPSNVIAVELRDAFGNLAAAPLGGQAFTAHSTSAGDTFWYEDDACHREVQGGDYVIPAGSSSLLVYYRDTRAGTPELGLSNTGGLTNPASQPHTVVAAQLAQLRFVTLPQEVTAGACSGAVSVRTEDAFGNERSPDTALSIDFGSSGGTTLFFSDPDCSVPVSSVALTPPSYMVTVYAMETRAGDTDVIAAEPTLAPVQQTLSVLPDVVTQLVFVSSVQTVPAGDCSSSVVLQTRDAHGNVAPVSAALPLTLSSSSMNGAFFEDAACKVSLSSPTMAAGTSDLVFRYTDTKAGSPTLFALTPGLPGASINHHIIGGPAASLTISELPTAVTAGDPVAFDIVPLDAFGNPPTGYLATVGVTSTDASAQLPSAATFDGLQPSKSLSVSFVTSGSHTLTVTDDSAPPLSVTTGPVSVNAGAPTELVFTSMPRTFLSRKCSGASQAITVQLRDAHGNVAAAPSGGVSITADSSTGATGQWFTDEACSVSALGGTFHVPSGQSTVALFYLDTAAGSPTVTLSASGLTLPAGQTHIVLPLPPSAVMTLSASRESALRFRLEGEANPEGLASLGWFRYDVLKPTACDDTFGTRVPAELGAGTELGSGTAATSFEAVVGELVPDTVYWYCAIASSADGVSYGELRAFRTPGAPRVTTRAAVDVAARSARVRGAAMPNGEETVGWLRVSTRHPGVCEDSFGTRYPASDGYSLGGGEDYETFYEDLSGLAPETTYYVCAFASNAFGSTAGEEVVSFSTPALAAGPPDANASGFWLDEGINPEVKSFEGIVTARVDLRDAQGLKVPVGPEDRLILEAEVPLRQLGTEWTFDSQSRTYVMKVSLAGCIEDDPLELKVFLNGARIGDGLSVTPICVQAPTEAVLSLDTRAALREVAPGAQVTLEVRVTDSREEGPPLQLLLHTDEGLELGSPTWKAEGGPLQRVGRNQYALSSAGRGESRVLVLTATVSGTPGMNVPIRTWLETDEGVVVSEESREELEIVPYQVGFGCGCSQGASGTLMGIALVALAMLAKRRHRT